MKAREAWSGARGPCGLRVGHDLTTKQDCSVSNEHTTLVHKINFNKSLSHKILKLFTQYFLESFQPHKCHVDKAITKVMKLELNHSRRSDILINPGLYFTEYQVQSIRPTREKLLHLKVVIEIFPSAQIFSKCISTFNKAKFTSFLIRDLWEHFSGNLQTNFLLFLGKS